MKIFPKAGYDDKATILADFSCVQRGVDTGRDDQREFSNPEVKS
jgi:hypothetical protein